MERIEDLIMMVGELRSDMNRRFDGMDAKFERRFDAVDAKFDAVDVKFQGVSQRFDDVRASAHRDFQWIVGIQLTTMAAIIVALLRVLVQP